MVVPMDNQPGGPSLGKVLMKRIVQLNGRISYLSEMLYLERGEVKRLADSVDRYLTLLAEAEERVASVVADNRTLRERLANANPPIE